MTQSTRTHVVWRKAYLFLALLLSGNILLFYALPKEFFIAIFLFLAVTYFLIGGSNALLVTFALLVSTIFVETILHVTGLGDSIYYRPHERFSIYDKDLGHRRYKANVDYKGLMPHGDLRGLAISTNVDSEPREIVFRTDSLGFRNIKDYNGQQYVLVGDSFVVGTGTTQEMILTEKLRNQHAIDMYNLSHPGELGDYTKYVGTFRRMLNNKPRVILFLFEGNDFPEPKVSQTKTIPILAWRPGSQRLAAMKQRTVELLKSYRALFGTTSTHKFFFSLRSRIAEREEQVDVLRVRDISVAFHRPYISVSMRKERSENTNFEKRLQDMQDVLVHIFFIPTKYRVYCKHLVSCSGEGVAELPNMQWQYLRDIGERLGLATTDLTPALVRESDRLLDNDVLTFWRDDTHWNQHGIEVAARQVAEILALQQPDKSEISADGTIE